VSKPSSPALALGACTIFLLLVAWNPRAGRVPAVDPGPPPRCAAGAHPVDGVCLSPTKADEAVTVAPERSLSATSTAVAQVVRPTPDEACSVLAEGPLTPGGVFGDDRASRVYVSYRTAEVDDRDVVLSGGTWLAAEQIEAGYYWIYVGCSEEEITEKVNAFRLSVNLSLANTYAGPGDAHLFRYVPGTVLEPAPFQRHD